MDTGLWVLEQCVRNVMVRGEYRPPRPAPHGVREELASAILGGALTVDPEPPRRPVVAPRLGEDERAVAPQHRVDRRTVKEKVDAALLAQLTRADGRRHAHTSDPG